MFLQITDCSNSECVCPIAPHDQRVGIVEAERLGHADSDFAKLVRDWFKRQLIAAFQNFLGDRSGVLGINVDLSGAKRFPDDDRTAHALTMLSGNSSIAKTSLGDFTENVGFSEFLGADPHRLGSSRRINKERKNAGKKEEPKKPFLFSCF